ncbi:MAG: prepilin-type N-terminal cleavage/methylation domain-containing protein, partial [Phycisphaerae bacterium]
MHASGRRAFTVVELVIVMLIIGIAATLVLPQFGTTDTARLIMASR